MKNLSHAILSVTAITVFGFALACGGGGDSDLTVVATPGGGGSAGAVKSMCDMPADSECTNNREDAYMLGESFLSEMCGAMEGTFAAGKECATDNVVGRCDDEAGSITLYYSTGEDGYTAATAKEDCDGLESKFIP